MNLPSCRRPLCAGLLLACLCGHAAGASFTTLDDAQGGFLSAISRDGHIATGSYVGGGTFAGSWIWRRGEGGKALPLIASGGMNSWGQPIGGSADNGSGKQVAALVYSDVATNGPVLIGPYPGSTDVDNFYSQVYGVSDDGTAVGLAYDPSGNPIAFRWTAADGMTRLPVNRPQTFSRANGISGSGSTIFGWNDRADGYRSGVIWIDGTPVEPHNFGMYGDAFGSPPGEPLGSSFDGSVVVGQGYWDDNLQSEAWRWTLATDTQPIGLLIPQGGSRYAGMLSRYKFPAGERATTHSVAPSGFFQFIASFADAVSADGNIVVGTTGIQPDQMDAFIWTPSTGMVFLADYAASRGVTIPAGFLLYGATAISADGKVIAGTGIDPTGTYVVPWVMDLHDDVARDVIVTAQGAISANDLNAGPFAGFPVGASVTMQLHLSPHGSAITPAHASDYAVRVARFNVHAHYLDPSDFSHHDADETLAPGTAVLHLVNDNPRADGLTLDPTATATAGQTVQLHVSDAGGALFDSDQAAGVDRGFSAQQLDAGSQWRITDGVHSMNVTLQFVTIADDMDGIFSDGFDGG